MFTVVSVSEPKYINSSHTAIDCTVVINKDGSEWEPMPYTITPNDTTQHGIDLWNGLINGVHGAIIPYTESSEELSAAKSERIRYMEDQCDAEIIGGISVGGAASGVLSTVHNYDTRQFDQLNWDAALSMSKTNTNPAFGEPGHDSELPPSGQGWIVCNDPSGADGYIKRGHTESQIDNLRSAFLLHKLSKSEKKNSKVSDINSQLTVATVNAINW